MAKGGKAKGGNSSADLMTSLGWLLALILMVFGVVYNGPAPATNTDPNYEVVSFKQIKNFINYPSLAITIGGTVAALMIAFPASAFAQLGKHMKIALKPTKYDTQTYITQISEFAKEARMKGLLSLEDKLAESKDEFLRSSLMLVVDSVEPEKVHNLLQAELDHLDERHAQARTFYDKGGAFAPGFGMIGTLIGLINMLQNMANPDSLGPAMSTALITTLYGSMMANLYFSPISNKLKVRHEEEYLCKVLICEGVEAIQAGENPKFIEEKLQMLVINNEKGGKKGKKGKKGKDDGGDE